jgi:hypothetical protein
MAKGKPVKEASTAVIVWAVFMTLLAIGLGVFVYVLYSDQDKINADMAKAASDLKNARTGEAEAQQVALVYRVAMGIPEGDDLEKAALIKEGDKGFQELKKINDAVKNRLPKLYETQVAKVDDAFAQFYRAAAQANPMPPKLDVTTLLNEPANFWPAETDDRKQLKPPTAGTGLLQLAVKDRIFRDLSLALAVNDRKGYEDAVARLDTSAKSYGDARTAFTKKAADLPNEFKNKLDEINKQSDQRRDTYQRDQAETRKEVAKLTERIETAETEKQGLDRVIKNLKDQQAALLATQKQADPFQYDAPQGKITARPSDELVEINLGSNAAVTPGLTFTVLPSDFPQKGRQSRMKMLRLPDERGQYRNVETFVPKATIEVVEVIGPDVSRARVTSEDSPEGARRPHRPGRHLRHQRGRDRRHRGGRPRPDQDGHPGGRLLRPEGEEVGGQADRPDPVHGQRVHADPRPRGREPGRQDEAHRGDHRGEGRGPQPQHHGHRLPGLLRPDRVPGEAGRAGGPDQPGGVEVPRRGRDGRHAAGGELTGR